MHSGLVSRAGPCPWEERVWPTVQYMCSVAMSGSLKRWSEEDKTCHVWQTEITESLSHRKRASEGRRHWTHKHLVTYRTHTYPQLSVSRTEAKWTKRRDVTAKTRGQESVNRLSQFMLCTQAIYFFTRRAINIAVLTIIIIIHTQLIHTHTHSRQNNTAHTQTHTSKCPGIQTHPRTNTPSTAPWDVTFSVSDQ